MTTLFVKETAEPSAYSLPRTSVWEGTYAYRLQRRGSQGLLVAQHDVRTPEDVDEHGNRPYLATFRAQDRQYLTGPFSQIGRFFLTTAVCDGREAAGRAIRMLREGSEIRDLGRWHTLLYWARPDEQEVTLLMTKNPLAVRAGDFSPLGFHAVLADSGQRYNIAKYLNRLFSHHHCGMFFGLRSEVLEARHDARGQLHALYAVVMESGARFTVRVKPSDRDASGAMLQDGLHEARAGAFRRLYAGSPELEKNAGLLKVGWSGRISQLDSYGLAKGHLRLLPDEQLDADFVFIEKKPILAATGEQFTLGVMGEAHGVEGPKSDLQSILNFALEPFLPEWAVNDWREIYAEFRDPARSRERVCSMIETQGLAMPWDPDAAVEGETVDTYLPAVLLRVHEQHPELGLDKVNLIPAAARRLAGTARRRMEEMCLRDPGGHMRISIPEEVAHRLYIAVDPTAVNPDGTLKSCGVLQKGEAFARGKEGPAWVFRQPNGHSGEKFRVNLVGQRYRELLPYLDSWMLLVSVETIVELLETDGGGDQDDPGMTVFGERLVAHLDQLPAYGHPAVPAARQDQAEEPDREEPDQGLPELGARLRDLFSTGSWVYSKGLIEQVCERMSRQHRSLGSIVLRLMLYNHMHRLGLAGEEVVDIREIGWRLEDVIDACTKDGKDIRWVMELLDAFEKSLAGRTVPQWVMRKFGTRFAEKLHLEFAPAALDRVANTLAMQIAGWDLEVARFEHHAVLKYWDQYGFGAHAFVRRHVVAEGSPAERATEGLRAVWRELMDTHKRHYTGVYLDEGLDGLERAKAHGFPGYRQARAEGLSRGQILAAFPPHPFTFTPLEELLRNPRFAILWSNLRMEMTREDEFAAGMILGLAYDAAQYELFHLFRRDPDIHLVFCELWRRIYGGAVDFDVAVDAQGEPLRPYHIRDGVLWGRDTAVLMIKALIWAKNTDPGDVSTSPQDISAEQLAPDTGRQEAYRLDQMAAQDGIVRVVLVNGYARRGFRLRDIEVKRWKQGLAGHTGRLVQAEFEGGRALKVVVEGVSLEAWVDKVQAQALWERAGREVLLVSIGSLPGIKLMGTVL